jgi:hypothetical protein
LTYIATFLSLIERKHVHNENLDFILRAIAALPDDGSRDVAILQHVRTLVLASSACIAAAETAH